MYSRSRQAGGGTASNVAPVAGVSPARSRSVGPPSAPVPSRTDHQAISPRRKPRAHFHGPVPLRCPHNALMWHGGVRGHELKREDGEGRPGRGQM